VCVIVCVKEVKFLNKYVLKWLFKSVCVLTMSRIYYVELISTKANGGIGGSLVYNITLFKMAIITFLYLVI